MCRPFGAGGRRKEWIRISYSLCIDMEQLGYHIYILQWVRNAKRAVVARAESHLSRKGCWVGVHTRIKYPGLLVDLVKVKYYVIYIGTHFYNTRKVVSAVVGCAGSGDG